MRRSVLHFAQDDDTSGFFPQLARFHDRDRFRMLFGTLGPMASWLRAYMESQGVSCFSLGCRGRGHYPLGFARLVGILRREGVDILHAHLFDPSVVALAAGALARTPVRLLTRHHSDYHTRIGKTWHSRLDRLCTRLSHGVIAVSRHTADHLVGVEGAPSGKVHVVPNGLDFERVRVSGPGAAEALRRGLAPRGETLLLTAARFHPEKGYEHLFAAAAELRLRTKRPFLLLVAGAGPRERAYRALVRQLGCDDVVRFLGFRKDLPDLMVAADVFVLASVAEAFGLVLAEALFLGTPFVATHVGGIPEIVEDGVGGLLVPAADSHALAGALGDLLDHPDRLGRLRGAGRERVVARFAFEAMVRSYESIYEGLGAVGP